MSLRASSQTGVAIRSPNACARWSVFATHEYLLGIVTWYNYPPRFWGGLRTLECHCEPVTDVTGVAIRFPLAIHDANSARICGCTEQPLRPYGAPPLTQGRLWLLGIVTMLSLRGSKATVAIRSP